MAGPRLLAPGTTQRLTTGAHQLRQLHITGAATYPSRFLASPKSVAAKTQNGEQNAHSEVDNLTGPKKQRPTVSRTGNVEKSTRQFNTSRSLKGVNDSSTIDFAYMPDSSVLFASPAEDIRVPILPHAFFPPRNNQPSEEIISVPRPEISTASADSTHISAPSAIGTSELSDTGLHIDFDAMTKKAIGAAEKIVAAAGVDQATKEEVVKKAQGMMQQVWTGLLDDMFGQKGSKKTNA